MDVYYQAKFQLCITSGSKISRDAPEIGCFQTPPRNRVRKAYLDPFHKMPQVLNPVFLPKLISYSKYIKTGINFKNSALFICSIIRNLIADFIIQTFSESLKIIE